MSVGFTNISYVTGQIFPDYTRSYMRDNLLRKFWLSHVIRKLCLFQAR